MGTKELLNELRKLSRSQINDLLEQAGFGKMLGTSFHHPQSRKKEPLPKQAKGLTPGLLRDYIVDIAEDFDAELPDSFWIGREEV